LIALAADEALRGRPVGYFSPLFKTAARVFDALAFMLAPLTISKNRSVGEIRLSTGGVIDVWSIPAQREPSAPSANLATLSFGRSLFSELNTAQTGTGADNAEWE